MPTIAQAIASNEARLANVAGEKTVASVPTLQQVPFSIPPVNSSMGLPSRGSLSPNFIIGSDFYNSAQQFRFAQRSSSPPPALAISKTSTPQSLVNKKLVAPVIGGGTKLNRYNVVKTTLAPTAVTNGVNSSQTFVATGVKMADTLLGYQWITKQTAGVTILGIRVTGINQITIDFFNPTAGTLTPTGGSLSLFLVQ